VKPPRSISATNPLRNRKQAATEVGEIVDDLVGQNKETDIKRFIEEFSLMTNEEMPQRRRTGLYGISAIAVALYQKGTSEYLSLLLNPVMSKFSDREPKVQLAAWDAMFNILMVCKEDIIFDKSFPITFDRIVSIVSYPNNDVKDWGRKLVEQLEDIVYGALVKNNIFDLDSLLDTIYTKLSKSKNQDISLVLIRWIETLSSMTNVDILKCLPRFLERFFEIMSTNAKHDVYDLTYNQLNVFLKDYQECQSRSVELDIQILRKALKFLLKKKSLDIDQSRYLAIIWLEEFLKFFNEDLVKEVAFEDLKDDKVEFYESDDSLPQFGNFEEEKGGPEEDKEESKDMEAERAQMREELGSRLFPEMLNCVLYYINTGNTEVVAILGRINTLLQKLVIVINLKITSPKTNKNELDPILVWLRKNFIKGKVKTKEICIGWFTELFKHYSDTLLNKEDEILENIIQSINFKESKLTESVLQLLCLMSSKNQQFLKEIVEMLLKRFNNEKDIEMEYINNLIHIMCSNIDQKLVFSEFAIEIMKFNNYQFVSFMIEILDLILSGAPVYQPLRDILSKEKKEPEDKEFFTTLFNTWWFNPLSALNLCFLAKKYKLAYHLLLWIGDNMTFDKDKLIQLWNIVQLIESPAFLELRIDLLDPGKNYYLIKTLQGILLMIPISKAFNALKTRLEWVNLDPRASFAVEAMEIQETENPNEEDEKEIQECLTMFKNSIDLAKDSNKKSG